MQIYEVRTEDDAVSIARQDAFQIEDLVEAMRKITAG